MNNFKLANGRLTDTVFVEGKKLAPTIDGLRFTITFDRNNQLKVEFANKDNPYINVIDKGYWLNFVKHNAKISFKKKSFANFTDISGEISLVDCLFNPASPGSPKTNV